MGRVEGQSMVKSNFFALKSRNELEDKYEIVFYPKISGRNYIKFIKIPQITSSVY